MSRIPNSRFAEPIGRAIRLLGESWLLVSDVQWWCADPVFTGLHGFDDTDDDRSYRDTAHTCYPWHIQRPANERVVTVVLPNPESPLVIVHELGHVLDHRLGFSHDARPVSDYAETDRTEAFAEAWTAWWFWDDDLDQKVLAQDQATVTLFEGLTGRTIEGAHL